MTEKLKRYDVIPCLHLNSKHGLDFVEKEDGLMIRVSDLSSIDLEEIRKEVEEEHAGLPYHPPCRRCIDLALKKQRERIL